jgi:translation initiation factor IF-2
VPARFRSACRKCPAAPAEVPTGDVKIIQIKPPIIVRDFATRSGLKPFKLISELNQMGISPR